MILAAVHRVTFSVLAVPFAVTPRQAFVLNMLTKLHADTDSSLTNDRQNFT